MAPMARAIPISDLRAAASMTKMRKRRRTSTMIEKSPMIRKKVVMKLPTSSARSRSSRFTSKTRNLVSVLSFSFELVLVLIGLALAFKHHRRETVLILAVILIFAFGHSLILGKIRYRIPILPEFFILAGVGVTALCAVLGRLKKSR